MGDAYNMMIDNAPMLADNWDAFGDVATEIEEYTELARSFITFHLRKAVNAARSGQLEGLPTGEELAAEMIEKRKAWKPAKRTPQPPKYGPGGWAERWN